MQKSGRVYTIELWRFFFCIAVLGLHVGTMFDLPVFTAGYLGVEFFFILSGYGIGTYYVKHMEQKQFSKQFYELGLYIGKRLKQLYPLYFVALLSVLIMRMVSQDWGMSGLFTYMKSGYAEFLMMQCGPMGGEVLISADWYVAAVFWAGIITLLLLILTGKTGGILICPLVGIGIYAYYLKLICKIDVIFSYHAVLRGIAGVCLGIFLCFLLRFLEERNMTEKLWAHKVFSCGCYILANIALLGTVIYMYAGHRGWKDFLVIGIYVISLFLLLATKVQPGERVERIFKGIGKTTYPIYILHMPVLELLKLL